MRKTLMISCMLLTASLGFSQKQKNTPQKEKNNSDTTIIENTKEEAASSINTVAFDDNDLTEGGNQNVSSILTAGRDPFNSAAAYNFGVLRFRIRGYESEHFSTYINGIPMENLDNGFTPFALWGGLNDVTRNKDLSIGLRPNTFSFGEIGNTTNMDIRAIKQRKQTEIGYAYSNRMYAHKWDVTHSTGISKKGWAFSFSASRRYSGSVLKFPYSGPLGPNGSMGEGYFPGTFYDGWSFFGAVDKRINQDHLLSFVAFFAPTTVGRQGTAVKEAFDLAGTDYNPNWGWFNGKKRNASTTKTKQPVFILTHDWRINNNTNLLTAASFSKGDRATGGLEWYNGDNPNPLYYRYLPSYWGDANINAQMIKAWQTDDNARQINWNKLYDGNTSHIDTFNGVVGRRSTYIAFDNVVNATRFNLNSVLNTKIGDHTEFTGGFSYQYQKNNNFKRITDLLGGDFFVDLNRFAERYNPANAATIGQSNLNTPNRIVKVGDHYGYNYDIVITKGTAWAQALMKYNNVDYFAALEFSGTSFYRKGNYVNGLFPYNSYGKSVKQDFINYSFKTGFVYKLNGRNYFFGNMSVLTKAPFYDNVYLSPRFRNTTQSKISSEGINTIEAGYTLNAPKLKVRLTGYYTEFKNQMNVLTFWHDTYQALVNYGITNINKVHSGGELGIEAKVMPNVTVNAAAAVGRYYYTSTQNAVTTIDNDASVVSEDVVYSKGYYVGGTPQQAYSFGATYRSPKFWSVGLTYNYFDEIYAEINPLRRTANAVQGYALGDPTRKLILDQTRLQCQSTLDLYAAYSLKLPKSFSINNKNTFLAFSLSVSNILNNRTLVPLLFEQLRFDATEFEKFPGRYSYSMGTNYSLSVALRF